MLKVVVSVFDSASAMYGQPVFAPSVGVAIRSFQDEVRRVAEGNALNAHPEDFVLHQLADFEESTGVFTEHQRVLIRGKDCGL